MPPPVVDLQARCHREGHALLLVSRDGARRRSDRAAHHHPTGSPGGSCRACGERDITSMYIISGDHEIADPSAGRDPRHRAVLRRDPAGEQGRSDRTAAAGGQGHLLRGRRHQRFDRDEEVPRLGVAARRLDPGRRHGRGDPARREPERSLPASSTSRASATGNMTMTMAAVLMPGLVCVAGVLLGSSASRRPALSTSLVSWRGMSAAMLPLATHRAPRPERPEGSRAIRPPADATLDERVLA